MKPFLLFAAFLFIASSCQKESTDTSTTTGMVTSIQDPFFEIYGKRWAQTDFDAQTNTHTYEAGSKFSGFYLIHYNGTIEYIATGEYYGDNGPSSGTCAGSTAHKEPESGAFQLFHESGKTYFSAQAGEWKGQNLRWEILYLDARTLKIKLAI